jgi:hypothetical protein
MTIADVNRRKLDLGRVFGDTFGVIRRQAGPLLGVTFVRGYLPGLANSYLGRVVTGGPPSPTAPFAALSNPLYLVLFVASLFLSGYLLACQLQIAIGDLEGQPQSLPDVLRRAVGKVLPLFGATFLLMLGVMLGMFLLFVPGMILAIMWAVALPATVADTSNPIRALGRSRALTRGNRWRIFGLAIIAWIVLLVFELIVFGALGGMASIARTGGISFLSVALISLFSVIIYVVGSAGSAALYTQLRELKGQGGESVAQVFA